MALAVGVPPASAPRDEPDPRPSDLIEAGRVGRAHGLDGSFYVTRGRAALLTLGAEVHLAGRRREIRRRAGADAHPIVRVDGVSDRASAEALRGETLLVASAQAPTLGAGEYWAHELEGCTVVGAAPAGGTGATEGRGDGEREDVGVVVRLIGLPSCEALAVRRPDGAELLIPLVRDAICEIDAPARRITVDLRFLGLEK